NSWATLLARAPTLLSFWAWSNCWRSWSVSELGTITSSPIMGRLPPYRSRRAGQKGLGPGAPASGGLPRGISPPLGGPSSAGLGRWAGPKDGGGNGHAERGSGPRQALHLARIRPARKWYRLSATGLFIGSPWEKGH